MQIQIMTITFLIDIIIILFKEKFTQRSINDAYSRKLS